VHFCPATRHGPCSFRFERSHIDGEAILHIGLEQSLIGFVNFMDGDDFDIGGDVVCAAKVEHVLSFGDAADGRAGEAAAAHDQAEGRDAQRLLRSADKSKVAFAAEQVDIGIDVVIGGNRIENEDALKAIGYSLITFARLQHRNCLESSFSNCWEVPFGLILP
jgi:hypothetical protein